MKIKLMIVFRLLKEFSRANGFRADSTLKLTVISSLIFLLLTFILFFTSQGRTIYFQISLFATPMTYLWMHFFPPQHSQS